MKNQVTQLSFDFEFNQVSTPAHFIKADSDEIMALENDLINGRGAWLYQLLLRELAHERKVARALAEFEALRAEAFKYNL